VIGRPADYSRGRRRVADAPGGSNYGQGTGDMKEHETGRNINCEWMVLPTDKGQSEERTQRIANAFFFSVTIFAVAFTYFVLSART
jgi:hypothetical protein